jgi:hypothetical protein
MPREDRAMTTEKRLYVVTVSHSAYAWAESFEEAEDFAEEIVRVEDYTEVAAHEANGNELGWEPNALVYHDGTGDLPLRDVLIGPLSTPTP